MSRNTRSRSPKDSPSNPPSMLAKVHSEMTERYIEVESDGISLVRLVCVYIAGAREARLRMLHGIRSLFGMSHAH